MSVLIIEAKELINIALAATTDGRTIERERWIEIMHTLGNGNIEAFNQRYTKYENPVVVWHKSELEEFWEEGKAYTPDINRAYHDAMMLRKNLGEFNNVNCKHWLAAAFEKIVNAILLRNEIEVYYVE